MLKELVQTRVLLLVEDNPGDAALVQDFLAGADGDAFRIEHVPRVADAAKALKSLEVDVIVLDLTLPDCAGVDSVRAIRQSAGDTPIVVLTGVDDEELALACIDAGAQDYLAKSEVGAQNLRRAIGYAITRRREAQLRQMKEALDRYRELSSASQRTTVTAAIAGSGAISTRSPDTFRRIVDGYFALLEPYLNSDVDQLSPPRGAMELIATAMGDANAGPRDLLDVHVAALDRAINQYDDRQSRSIVFEARLLALQMMGLLVDYYRVGHRRRFLEGAR